MLTPQTPCLKGIYLIHVYLLRSAEENGFKTSKQPTDVHM